MAFRVDKQVLQEMHSRHAESSRMWELKAAELRYGMEILFRQVFSDTAVQLKHRRRKSLRPSLHSVALMLAAMMIEALAKAVLVERKQTAVIGTLKDHNLRKAVVAAGYAPDPVEAALLNRLSEFLRWAGRYPVPWKPEHMAIDDERGGRNVIGGSLVGADLMKARTIADALERQLHTGSRVRTGMRLPSGQSSPDPRSRQRRQ